MNYTLLLFLLGIHVHPASAWDVCKECNCTKTDRGLVVDCAEKHLKNVPSHIPGVTSELFLSFNNIQTIPSNVFSHLHKLALLDLSNNSIEDIADRGFRGLVHLQVLYLHNNVLKKQTCFSANTFSLVPRLTTLTLSNNFNVSDLFLEYPDESLSSLTELTVLYMDGLPNKTFHGGFKRMTKLTTLVLSGLSGRCDIQHLRNSTFFNLPKLTYLNVSCCGIFSTEAGVFEPLSSIDTLDLSGNIKLGFPGASKTFYGLRNSTIRVLYAVYMSPHHSKCIEVRIEDTKYLKYTRLEELYVGFNSIGFVESGSITMLPKDTLTVFSARNNRFAPGPYLMDCVTMHALRVVDVSFPSGTYSIYGLELNTETPTLPQQEKTKMVLNPGIVFRRTSSPNTGLESRRSTSNSNNKFRTSSRESYIWRSGTRHSNGRAFRDNLRTHFLNTNYDEISITRFGKNYYYLPMNLRILNLSHSVYSYNIDKISFNPQNKLRVLDLSKNYIQALIGPITGLSQLEFLDVSYQSCLKIGEHFFSGLGSLRILNVSKNLLGDSLGLDEVGVIFGYLIRLEYLDLSGNRISYLPFKIFKGLIKLNTLILSNNKLNTIDIQVEHMTYLYLLDLSNIELRSIPRGMRTELDAIVTSVQDINLNIQSNPIACTCSGEAFLQWLQITHVLIVNNGRLVCEFLNGTKIHIGNVKDVVSDIEARCRSYVVYIAGTIGGFLLCVVMLSSCVTYQHRYKILYVWHRANAWRHRNTLEQDKRYTFDAFLSYAQDDRDFVIHDLLYKLEDEYGFALCVHERDFLGGSPISSNIVDTIHASRKTILLLSESFMASSWCLFEHRMAVVEENERRSDHIIAILYKTVPLKQLPREMWALLNTKTYLEYPDNENDVDLFWRRLQESLGRARPRPQSALSRDSNPGNDDDDDDDELRHLLG